MVGGQEGACSVTHLSELFVLADRAGLLHDPDLAAERMPRALRRRSGVGRSPPPADPSRLSLNQKTTNNWSVQEAAEGCARAIECIGLRDKVSRRGSRSARIVRDAGLRVSSPAGGGACSPPSPPPSAGPPRRQSPRRRGSSHPRDRRASSSAAGAGEDLEAARAMVEEGIGELAPYAAEVGVKLAIEPFHPVLRRNAP